MKVLPKKSDNKIRLGERLFDMNYKTTQLPMKAATAMFVLFALATVCFADPFKPAVIDDADGFTNIRATKGSDSRVIGRSSDVGGVLCGAIR